MAAQAQPPIVHLSLEKRLDLANTLARLCKVQLETAALRLDTLSQTSDPKTEQQLEVCRCDLRVKEIEERIARVNRRQLQRSLAARVREEKRRKEGKPPIAIPQFVPPPGAGLLSWHSYLKYCRTWESPADDATNEVLSSRLTYSLSAFAALSRLHLTIGVKNLELHVIGADWKEGRSVEASVEVFTDLAMLLRPTTVEKLNITLVGPHIETTLAGKHFSGLRPKGVTDPSVPEMSFIYSEALYHDYAADKLVKRPKGPPARPSPHLICAFNAGVWVFDEWTPTLLYIYHKMACPLVVTSYNMHESVEDRITMEEIGIKDEHWCWQPELNIFRSLAKKKKAIKTGPGKTGKGVSASVAPNTSWQCVWPLANGPYSLRTTTKYCEKNFGLPPPVTPPPAAVAPALAAVPAAAVVPIPSVDPAAAAAVVPVAAQV